MSRVGKSAGVAAKPPKPRRTPRAAVSPEDAALFIEAASGAMPLHGRDRVRVPPPPPRPEAARPAFEPPPPIALTIDDSGDRLAARAPGVNRAQIAELRSGNVRPEATLDLHGMIAADAMPALRRFLGESLGLRRRCVLVVHGRGLHSDGLAVLRELVVAELTGPLSGLVRGLAIAAARDGGPGATYVMVKA